MLVSSHFSQLHKEVHESKWLWKKCRERQPRFDWCSGSRGKWNEVVMDASSIAKCFLVPVWWGGAATNHDKVHKHLVISDGANGPSARIVLWKNYMGFDSRSARKNLGALIRAHSNKGYSDVDDIENANQSLLGSMLGKAVSAYVNTQLEYCGDLEVKIAGSNRDILNGRLKMVKVTAKQVVYKGIALSDVDLSASCLRVKLGRKRLLQNPLHVKASISMGENDLKASLTSPLLADYLKDILPEELSGVHGLAGVDVGVQDGIVLFTERQAVKNGCRSSNMRNSVALSFEIMNGGKTISISNAGPYKQLNSNAMEKTLSVGSETSIKKLGVFGSRLVIGGEFYITP